MFDYNEICSRYQQLRELLVDQIDIFYSLKANPNVNIAQIYCEMGAGVEVASLGELEIAIKAGFTNHNIIFSGPGKRPEEIQYAIKENVFCITVESLEELKVIASYSKMNGITVNIALRINPDEEAIRSSSMKMGGAPRQFGIDENQIPEVIEQLKGMEHIHLVGIHVYSGTQRLDVEALYTCFKNTFQLARKVQELAKVDLKMVNIGGGFGVPYFEHENELDIQSLTSRMNQLYVDNKQYFPNARIIIESGRYLIAEAGIYVSKVLNTKVSKGEKFVVVDGGMHHHASATFRGRLLRNNFRFEFIRTSEDGEEELETINIVGPLCTPEDCLAKKIQSPRLHPGDLVCVMNSGAYGLTFSPVFFLSHPLPYEVLMKDRDAYIIRQRGYHFDLLNNPMVKISDE